MLSKREAIETILSWSKGKGQFAREASCFAAPGLGIVALATEDNAMHVEFDFLTIWEAIKSAPSMPSWAYMFHTHPPGCHGMSQEDANSIKGWVAGLGMPIEMVIISDAGARHYMCEMGNKKAIIEDVGYKTVPNVNESLVYSMMNGISTADHPCSRKELIGITGLLNEIIPIGFWGGMDLSHLPPVPPVDSVPMKPEVRRLKPGWKVWTCPVTGFYWIYYKRMPMCIWLHFCKCTQCRQAYKKANKKES
jgi:hypothetical protein